MQSPSNPRRVGFRSKATLSLVAAVATVLAGQQARAADLTWDIDTGTTGPQDGTTATWSNGSNNWWDALGGVNVPWNNINFDSAIFGAASGTAGTVALGSDISVGNITFNPASSGNYTINGAGHTLTLGNTTIGGTASATLNANLAGTSGLIINITNASNPVGAGTIRLGGANTFSGPLTVTSGTLQIDSVGALGNSTDITVGNGGGALVGSLLINVPDATSTTMGAGKTAFITGSGINNFGALRGADNQSNTWAGDVFISGGSRISGGSNGTLNVTGVISGFGTLIFSRNNGATTVLSAVNTYTGDTQLFNSAINGAIATLKLGVDNAIDRSSKLSALPNAATGPEVVDLNGHVQWFRALETAGAMPTTAASAAFLRVTNNASGTSSTLTVGDPFAATNFFGGSIRDGAGTVSLVKEGVNTQVLAGANTYTGATTVNGGILQLGAPTAAGFTGSNGVLASTNFAINGGAFIVDNYGASNSNNNRLSDSADLTFRGGVFEYRGSDQTATNSSETVRNLTLAGGYSRISIRYNANPVPTNPPGPPAEVPNTTTFTANQLTQSNTDAIALVNGRNLGKDSTSTASVGRFFVTTAPTMVGTTAPLSTGINAAAKNTQIVPFLLGEAEATTGGLGTETGLPNTFVTYQAGTGFRPLNPIDEFTQNSIVPGNNIRISAATTATATAAINSLVVHGNNLTIANNQTLTVTSGAVLFASGNQINSPVGGVGTLDFGSTKGMITVATATATMSAKITGTNGLIFNGPGTLGLGSTVSTYSGNTVLSSGILVPQQSSVGPAGGVTSGPFGTSTLVFAGGGMRGTSSGPFPTIGNNISFQGNLTLAPGGNKFTLSGPVTLAGGTRTIINSTTGTASTTTFSGVISDGGQNFGLKIGGSGTSPVILEGANTYTGPTTVLSSTLIVSGSLTGSSTTFVGNPDALATTATLGGSGTLGNVVAPGTGFDVTSGANVDPGNAADVAGNMRTNAFSLTNGAHLNMQIGGIVAGGETTTGYDRITASGAVTLTGGDLKLKLLGTPTFNNGDQLFLIVNNSGSAITGSFDTLNLNGVTGSLSNIVLGGQEFALSYTGNFIGAGSDGIANDLVLTAVPEPAAGAVLAGAFGLLGCIRRRQRRC